MFINLIDDEESPKTENLIEEKKQETTKKRKIEEEKKKNKKKKFIEKVKHHIEPQEINLMQNDNLLSGTLVEYVIFKLTEKYNEHQTISVALSPYIKQFQNEQSDIGYLMKRIFELSSIDWNKKGLVIIPWNLERSQHWTLVVIDLSKELIYFFDSLSMNHFYEEVSKKIRLWLNLSFLDIPEKVTKFEILNCTKNKIHQKFGQSCGAFICFYVELLTRNLTINQI
eukprot:gene3697-6511_t